MRPTNIILILILFFLSCKKEKIKLSDSELIEGDVVFYFDGQVGQNYVRMEAGKENYFMFTDVLYDSSLKTFVFEGKMANYNCMNCYNTLKISILDDTTKLPSATPNITSLTSGTYSFYNLSDSVIKTYQLNLKITDTIIPNFNYTISLNGIPITYSHSVQNFPLPYNYLNGNHIYTISLSKNNGYQSCNSSITNTFYVNNNAYFYCYMAVSSFSGLATYKLYSNTYPQSNVSYTLYTGDNYSFTINNVPSSSIITTSHSYSPTLQHYYPVLVGKTTNGNTSTFSLEINPFIFFPSFNCAAPQYTFEIIPKFFKDLKNKVLVEWTNISQQTFLSILGPQPPGYGFKIISIEDYEKNSNNKPTKKIRGEINVRLYEKNNPNQWIDLKGNVCWAVAY